MKKLGKPIAGLTVALTLGASAIAYAHPGALGGHAGPGTQAGPKAGMQQHAMRGGHGPTGMQHRGHGSQVAQQFMTLEERTATMEKMRAAKTPEERQQIAAATRAERQKRATERGIDLPEQGGHSHRATTLPETIGHTH